MVNLQDVFLIILSLFANLKLMSVFYSWIIFSLQVGDIWSLYGGQAHYDYDYCYNLHFFILCDIWSTVENYFQKILRPPTHTHTPLKKSTPLLLLSITLKIHKLLVPPFCQIFLGNQLKESANRRCVCPN